MARSPPIGLPRRALPRRIGSPDDAKSDPGVKPGASAPRHGSEGKPRKPKRWRLFTGNGATSAFFREMKSEHSAPPAQPARSRSQSS
jgi:hypothetical protein